MPLESTHTHTHLRLILFWGMLPGEAHSRVGKYQSACLVLLHNLRATPIIIIQTSSRESGAEFDFKEATDDDDEKRKQSSDSEQSFGYPFDVQAAAIENSLSSYH